MARLFLDRPLVAVSPRENLWRQALREIFKSRRRAAHAFDNIRIHAKRKLEGELTFEPFETLDHVVLVTADNYSGTAARWRSRFGDSGQRRKHFVRQERAACG